MTTFIITICVLLLLAYFFDVTSSKTKIPSVILLLILGWSVKQVAKLFNFDIPDLTPILPVLGTIGLILIVLEGSLELEFNRSKLPLIGKSLLVSLLSIILLSIGLALVFQYFRGEAFKLCLLNAIPFAVISSAIAIPSARNLIYRDKEFITYESSLSDIFGVLFFNFITLNDNITTQSFGVFSIELAIIIIVSFAATVVLAFLLSKIRHHVKFIPIILIIIIIYYISKVFHLPALVFILLFGLFIGNLDELKRFKIINRFHPEILNKEVHKFKELVSEVTFLIRALFFLLFGYLIKRAELLNMDTIIWALAITISIFSIRSLLLRMFKMPMRPLLYIAPRGLITILLFLSIPAAQSMASINKSLIIQVIVLSALIMMFGLMRYKKPID